MVLTAGRIRLARAVLTASALIVVAAIPPLLAGAPAGERALLAGCLVLFAALWVWFWWIGLGSAPTATVAAAIALMAAALAVLTFAAAPGRDGLLFAAGAAGAALTARRGLPAILGIAALAAILQLGHGANTLTAFGVALNDVIVGVGAAGGRLLVETNRELLQARDDVAALAVADERLRLARDLHDLLGQDLTLAVLQNELLGRALPEGSAAAARERQAEVTLSLRKALDDLREAVGGFRTLSLETELGLARASLTTAGIRLDLRRSGGRLAPEQDAALAWAVREGVTNVVRHSAARTCRLVVREAADSVVLEIEDDGVGPAGSRSGSGQMGLAERLAGVGGRLETSAGEGGGYRLVASLPLPPK